MSKSKQKKCADCRLFLHICVCNLMQPFLTKTRVSLVIHKSEFNKTSNTGRIVHSLLENSKINIFGEKDKPLQVGDFWQEDYSNIMLYPASQLTIDHLAPQEKPVNLIVPDGNWGQARTIVKKIQTLLPIVAVGIPLGIPSEYVLRVHPDPEKICTIEAIYRALCVFEKDVPLHPLMDMFRIVRDRLLWKGGARKAPDPSV
ncbi:MAG: DTW domain-containing protein [Oligoflexales bacterium]|nr:DTW domain-containing protein [Oligoflexales bacterium]